MREKQDDPSLEVSITALEERVEGLHSRVKELAGENARLKGALLETAAERDRLKREIEEARDVVANQVEASEKIQRYEAEREAVKARIERLLKGLEEAEAPAAT